MVLTTAISFSGLKSDKEYEVLSSYKHKDGSSIIVVRNEAGRRIHIENNKFIKTKE